MPPEVFCDSTIENDDHVETDIVTEPCPHFQIKQICILWQIKGHNSIMEKSSNI
jgi:hypothetical protein